MCTFSLLWYLAPPTPRRVPPPPSFSLSVSVVQLSSSLFGYQSPSEEARVGNMKSAKSQVNHTQQGENQRALSPLQSTLSSAASPSQAYETYIDNGLICLKHKIRNIEKKKVTFHHLPFLIVHDLTPDEGADILYIREHRSSCKFN